MSRIAQHAYLPTRPREIEPEIPRDLETIVLKAIAEDPARRYPTAGKLAEDLERFLTHRPIRARRTSWFERFWRWARRNKAVAALGLLTLSLLVLVSIVMTISLLHARTANEDVQAALARVTRQRTRSEATLQVAIDALDGIYEKFAPSDLHDCIPARLGDSASRHRRSRSECPAGPLCGNGRGFGTPAHVLRPSR